ncbi:MAG TPA: uroporphyrinogen decarboxylase family protein [Candidatus Brocadiia bacterium]|nr:uroporphyrinogen decarboxylase family protein [Candidatus Brocadiia bacterium]
MMTLRERFRRTMFYQKPDYLPNYEFGYWAETLPLWHEQGLPKEINDEGKAYDYFGIEAHAGAPVNNGSIAGFEHKVLEDTDEYTIYIDGGTGSTAKINKKGYRSIPHFIGFPLKDRKSWEEIKWRFDPDKGERYPKEWDKWAQAQLRRDYPLVIGIGSMLGVPRNFIGFENTALMAYDDPDLLDDIVETMCNCVVKTIERAVKDVEFDAGAGWEDICFNSGPLISPTMFEKLVTPRYRRIADLLNLHGCHILYTDCDGDITPIVPQFLKGGINCMFPVEVNAGSDPVNLRDKFGRELRMMGGVCKRKLAAGPKAIEKELKRIEPVVRDGGFIPHVDHRCPADVTLENYRFYMKLKREMFGCTAKEPQCKL